MRISSIGLKAGFFLVFVLALKSEAAIRDAVSVCVGDVHRDCYTLTSKKSDQRPDKNFKPILLFESRFAAFEATLEGTLQRNIEKVFGELNSTMKRLKKGGFVKAEIKAGRCEDYISVIQKDGSSQRCCPAALEGLSPGVVKRFMAMTNGALTATKR